MTWGKPHFRVGENIFAGYGEENGKHVVGFKLEMAHASIAVQVPGFSRAPYVGHKGWVSLETDSVKDWDEVREMILELLPRNRWPSYMRPLHQVARAQRRPEAARPAVESYPNRAIVIATDGTSDSVHALA